MNKIIQLGAGIFYLHLSLQQHLLMRLQSG